MIWCDRSLWQCRYFFGLCLSEADFNRQMRRMSVPRNKWPLWVGNFADASTHFLDNEDGRRAAIVCLNPRVKLTGIQLAAVLVHEAVHIWQEHRDMVGEKNPSSESEAYAIQSIAQRLMEAYQEARKK